MRSALPYSTDPSSALVSIDPRNGEIRAMDSSSPYSRSQFNLAAQGHRQPGSTFKAFVLTTALKQGIDPYTTYYVSKPLNLNLPRWGHWTVHTADEGYQGKINLKQATVTSDNTVFAQLDLDVGPETWRRRRSRWGSRPTCRVAGRGNRRAAIGVSPLELADAYSTLASGGIHHNPVAIRRVVFPGGKGRPPRSGRSAAGDQPPVAYQVTRLLHDNITEGTGTAAYTGCAGQAGKTGTTDNYTDAWFSGYQPNLATAVWVGYPQSNEISMTTFTGSPSSAAPSRRKSGTRYTPTRECRARNSAPAGKPTGRRSSANSPSSAPRLAVGGRGGGGGGAPPPGSAAVGGYNPDAYAPGVGQKPAPLPPRCRPNQRPPRAGPAAGRGAGSGGEAGSG